MVAGQTELMVHGAGWMPVDHCSQQTIGAVDEKLNLCWRRCRVTDTPSPERGHRFSRGGSLDFAVNGDVPLLPKQINEAPVISRVHSTKLAEVLRECIQSNRRAVRLVTDPAPYSIDAARIVSLALGVGHGYHHDCTVSVPRETYEFIKPYIQLTTRRSVVSGQINCAFTRNRAHWWGFSAAARHTIAKLAVALWGRPGNQMIRIEQCDNEDFDMLQWCAITAGYGCIRSDKNLILMKTPTHPLFGASTNVDDVHDHWFTVATDKPFVLIRYNREISVQCCGNASD